MKNRILIMALALFMVTPGLTVVAQTVADLQAQQREIQRERYEQREYLYVTYQEMQALEEDIRIMDASLDEATYRLEVINYNIFETMVELAETELELEEAREVRDEMFERLKNRIRVMYIHGPAGYLEVVLQATSFSDFLTRLDHMNRVARHDREMIDQLEEAEARIEQRVEQTHIQLTRIEALRVMQADMIMDLNIALDHKYVFMSQLERDAHQHEIAIQQLEQADREITAAIRAIHAAQAAEEARRRAAQEAERRANQPRPTGGSMSWPLPGIYRVTSEYGNRTHPISRRQEFHTGIDIGAPSGTSIRAAYRGEVIISGWNGGFGNTVVIDHGGGITTLYAHNSRNLVAVGDIVYTGQEIARVGSTGVSTGPHLHFEVRDNGRHVDPNPFVGRRP